MKRETLCWRCEWAAGKDGKCAWASRFKPVPGWKATPTVLTPDDRPVDSFDVIECPLFEKDHRIQKKRRNFRRLTEEDLRDIERLINEGHTSYYIADITGFDKRTAYGAIKKIKERKNEL